MKKFPFYFLGALFLFSSLNAEKKIYIPNEAIIIDVEGIKISLNGVDPFPVTALMHDHLGYFITPSAASWWPWWVCHCGYVNSWTNNCCQKCYDPRPDTAEDNEDEEPGLSR